MSDTRVNIRNHESLVELRDCLVQNSQSLLDIISAVSEYLEDFMSSMEEKLQVFEERLREAEEALSEAESDYSSCLASRKYDEESGEYRPSCNSEERRRDRARNYKYKCQEQYDKAKKIIEDCKREIEDYKFPGSATQSPGGEATIDKLSTEHTKNATEKLQEIIDVVDEYQALDMSNKKNPNSKADQFRLGQQRLEAKMRKEDKPLSNEEKIDRFKAATERIREEQDIRHGNLAEADVTVRCRKCHLPISMCRCPKKMELTPDTTSIIINQRFRSR